MPITVAGPVVAVHITAVVTPSFAGARMVIAPAAGVTVVIAARNADTDSDADAGLCRRYRCNCESPGHHCPECKFG
jgi:hypothetical protein